MCQQQLYYTYKPVTIIIGSSRSSSSSNCRSSSISGSYSSSSYFIFSIKYIYKNEDKIQPEGANVFIRKWNKERKEMSALTTLDTFYLNSGIEHMVMDN